MTRLTDPRSFVKVMIFPKKLIWKLIRRFDLRGNLFCEQHWKKVQYVHLAWCYSNYFQVFLYYSLDLWLKLIQKSIINTLTYSILMGLELFGKNACSKLKKWTIYCIYVWHRYCSNAMHILNVCWPTKRIWSKVQSIFVLSFFGWIFHPEINYSHN